MQGLWDYLCACDTEPFDDEACRGAMYAYLQAFQGLRLLFRRHLDEAEHASQPWHTRPKCHALQHVVEECTALWGSPKRFWRVA